MDVDDEGPEEQEHVAAWAWGHGQAWGNDSGAAAPVRLQTRGRSLRGLGVAWEQALLVMQTGALWAAGTNAGCWLFEESPEGPRPPARVDLLELEGHKVEAAAGGRDHVIAILEDGDRVLSWGQSNEFGQLGHGSTALARVRPRAVALPLPRMQIRQVACGEFHSLVLTVSGSLYAFGDGSHGALGLGSLSSTSQPAQVEAGEIRGMPLRAVAAGAQHSLALSLSGSVLAWGNGRHGRLGLGPGTGDVVASPALVPRPSELARFIAAGGRHSAVILQRGHCLLAGDNQHGQLGRPPAEFACGETFMALPGKWRMAALGSMHSLLLGYDGNVYSCGINDIGQLGCGDTAPRPPLQQVLLRAREVVVGLVAGPDHGIVLTTPTLAADVAPKRSASLGHQQLRLAVAQAKQKFMRTASDRGGALSCRASLSGASAGVLPAVGEEEVVARERPSGDEEDGDDSPLVRCNAYVGGSRPLTAPAAMVTDDDDADNQEQDAEGSDGELPRTLSGGCRSRLSKDLTVKLAAAPETGAQRLEATLRPMAWPGVCLSARFAGLDVPMLLGLIEGLRLGPEAAAKGRAELRRALGTVLASPSLLNASFCFPGLRRPRVDAAGLQRTLEELWATGQVDQQLEAQLRDAAAQGLRRWGGDPGAWADAPPPLRHRDQLRGLPTLLLFPLVAEAETSPHACALMEQLANLIASLPGEGRRVLVDIVMEDMVPVLRSVLVRNVRRFCNAAIRKAAQSRFMGSAVWNGLLVLDLLAFANQAYQRQLRSQLPAHLSAPDPSFTRTLSRGLSKTASEGVPGAGAGGAAARPESAAAAGASFGLAAAALGPPVPPSDFQLEALAEDVVPPDVEFALFMQNAQSKIPSAAEVLTLRPHDERLHSFMVHRDLLPPAFVRRVLQRENLFRQQLQQQRNLQELLQAAMMGQVQPGPGGMLSIDPSQMFFMLQVRREHLLEDTMEALQNAAPADLQRQIKVSFRGEEGQDAGGVSREFFRLLGEQLFSLKSGLFDQKVAEEARVLWFDQSSPRDVADFWLVGVIVGLAVYNNLPGLDVRFPVCAFKKLRGEALGLEDLAEVQPPVAGSLGALLAWEPPEGTSAAEAAVIFESTFCLDFSVTYEERGAPRAVDLRPGGSETPVTPANRQEFVRLYCEWVLERSVERQFASFKKGFSRICESPLFQALRGSELAQIVMGEAELDLQDLRPKARLEGFSPDSDFIKGFWEILGTFDEGQRRGFLAFVTGSNRAPVGGLKELALLVQRNGGESDRLPLAHTCFNTLLLPEYSSQRRLREALLTAIENAEGFGLE